MEFMVDIAWDEGIGVYVTQDKMGNGKRGRLLACLHPSGSRECMIDVEATIAHTRGSCSCCLKPSSDNQNRKGFANWVSMREKSQTSTSSSSPNVPNYGNASRVVPDENPSFVARYLHII